MTYEWAEPSEFEVPDRIAAVAKAIDKMSGQDADRIITVTMVIKKCSSLEAEAALLIADLNELGYDITKLEDT